MDNKSNTESAIDAGMKINVAKIVHETETSKHFIIPQGFEIVEIEDYKIQPDRKTGQRTFTSTESFNSYVNKHKNEDQTIIVADSNVPAVKAIFNDDGKDTPAWSDFSAKLELKFSRQWLKWIEKNNRLMSQEEFAQFIEDNRIDFMCGGEHKLNDEVVKTVNPVEFKKLILDLNLSVSEKIKSKLDVVTGETIVSYSNEDTGDKTFKVPSFFVIVIPVYKTGDYFKVIVRMRRRTSDGRVQFGFLIDQVDQAIESAFEKICKRVKEGQTKENNGDSVEEFKGTGIEVYKGPLN